MAVFAVLAPARFAPPAGLPGRWAAVALALLLSACSNGGADKDGDGRITMEEVAAELAAAETPMRAGRWEQTTEFTEISVTGMPRAAAEEVKRSAGRALSFSRCFTDEELNGADPAMFRGPEGMDCSWEEFDIDGASFEVRMICEDSDEATMTLALDGEFGAHAYEMSMSNTISGGGREVSMKGEATGRRIGDCS